MGAKTHSVTPAASAPTTMPVIRVGLKARSASAPRSAAAAPATTILRVTLSGSSAKLPMTATVAANPTAAARPPRRRGKRIAAASNPATNGSTLD
jgi:hypothetical protein